MQLRYHGGGCCGVRHLIGFGNNPERNWRDYFNNPNYANHTEEAKLSFITSQVRGPISNNTPLQYAMTCADSQAQEFENIMEYAARELAQKTIEVILNDVQVAYADGYWPKKLREHGFELKHRFYNNRNSWCNVFIKSLAKKDDKTPKWWSDLEEKEEKKAA